MTPADLNAVFAALPRLIPFGLADASTPEAEVLTGQQELRRRLPAIAQAAAWLRANCEPTERVVSRRGTPTSYGLKHLAEPEIGYTTNGEFIAAAVHAGIPYLPLDVNVLLGVRAASLQAIRDRVRARA